ncbi:hypothetical protein GF343_03720 [Candidatus Woesearchaeota archaeon]|nr:hypothetical protein [Candidatus Woesearchaeota archaeon]
MDIESDFDSSLIYVVRKYSVEEAKWQLDNGGRELLEKYPDLKNQHTGDVIENWKQLQTGINSLVNLLNQINDEVMPGLGTIVLEQSDKKTKSIEWAQAYLDLAKILENLLDSYADSKDTVVEHYTMLAETAVNLAGKLNVYDVYKELESKEFRNRVYRTVFPTLATALKASVDVWEKSGQASDAYASFLLCLKTNPVISAEFDMPEQEESFGRRRSLFEEQKRFAEKNIRKVYEDE